MIDLTKTPVREPRDLEHGQAPADRTLMDGASAGGSAASKLLRFLDLLSANHRSLLAIGITGALLSVLLAFVLPVRYESVTRLMPPDESTGISAAMLGALTSKVGDNIGALAGDLLGMHTTGATLVGILTSRTVQDDLINRFDLRKVYGEREYQDARKVLARRTDISEDRKSGIITIKVHDSNRERAAQLARGYVDELNGRVSQLTTSSAHRERVFLEGRLASIKQQLDQSTAELSRFSSKSKTFDPQVEGKAMLEAGATLQGQLIAAESELRGLEQIYGPANTRVRAAAARVAELRSQLKTLSGNGSANSSTDAANDSTSLYPSLQQLPLLGNTYYDLARQAKINETVYEILTKQFELAKVEEAKEIPTIKVLDEPVVPERKIWPPRLLIILLGTVLAFCLGIVWIVGRDSWQALDSRNPRKLVLLRVSQIFSGEGPAKLRSR